MEVDAGYCSALAMLDAALRLSHGSAGASPAEQQQQERAPAQQQLPADVAEAVDIVVDVLRRHCEADAHVSLEAVTAARTIINHHAAGSPRVVLALRAAGAAQHAAAALRAFPNRQALVLQAVTLLAQLLSTGALAPLAFLRQDAAPAAKGAARAGQPPRCEVPRTLAAVLEIHVHNGAVACAVLDLLLLFSRHERAAVALLGAPAVLEAVQSQLRMLSNAEATASAVRLLKQLAKHAGTRQTLRRHCQEHCTLALLVDIARVLRGRGGGAAHFKTLKRAYRTVFLLSRALFEPVARPEEVPLSAFKAKGAGRAREKRRASRASNARRQPAGSDAADGVAVGPEPECSCSCRSSTELRWFPEHSASWCASERDENDGEEDGASPRRAFIDCHCADGVVRGISGGRPVACRAFPAHGGAGAGPPRDAVDGAARRDAFNAYDRDGEVAAMLHFMGRVIPHPQEARPAACPPPAGVLAYDADGPSGAGAGGGDGGLCFESNFESGNLRRAVRVGRSEYDLYLRHDINDPAMRCQWFLFSVRCAVPGAYRFNILNASSKKTSLFQAGQRPLVWRDGRDAWERAGDGIAYFPSPLCQADAGTRREQQQQQEKEKGPRARGLAPAKKSHRGGRPGAARAAPAAEERGGPDADGGAARLRGGLYGLSFSLAFETAGAHHVSYCFPYTYTSLQRFLRGIFDGAAAGGVVRRSLLCKTVMGHRCDLLTVTDFAGGPPVDDRDYVFISARVHPGESNSSFVMDGLIRRLLAADEVARRLRSRFVFKIVPMLNPDGVVNGCTRCNIAGADLNRQWDSPKKHHPTIKHAKRLCESLAGKLKLFVDLHGHSRETDFFLFGCGPPLDGGGGDDDAAAVAAAGDDAPVEHALPRILAKRHRDFSLGKCAFTISKSKQGTGRVVLNRDVGCQLAYTLEASLAGGSARHFSGGDLRGMGGTLVEAIDELLCAPL